MYPVPDAFAANARIRRDDYQRLYAESLRDPDAFWGEAAKRLDKVWFYEVRNDGYDPDKISGGGRVETDRKSVV